jgi:hypothetical protein
VHSATGVYKICTCPYCQKRYAAKFFVNIPKNITVESEKLNDVLENVTVKTIALDGELEESIQGSLKPIIKDEKLYVEVMQRVHEVFEARL